MGGGWTIYQGISRLRHPIPPEYLGWNYVVLAVAAVFEFYSWRISYPDLRSRKDPDESTWDEIIGSKDPTIFTVFLEDSAGMIGTLLAFLGIFGAQMFHRWYIDPAASILIGFLLAAVAVLLARESGSLLPGERTNRARIARVREIIRQDPAVEDVGDLLTMQLGPEKVLLNVDIRFRSGLDVRQLESAIERIFIEADSIKGVAGDSSKAA